MRSLAIAILAVSLPVLAPAAPPPVGSFTNFARYESMKISPTGKYLALTRRNSDHEIMTVLSFPDLKASMQRHFGSLNEVARFEWINERRMLLEPQRRFPGLTSYKARTGELFGIDADGKNGDLLFGYQAGVQQTGTNIAQRKSTYAPAEILGRIPGQSTEVLIQTYGYGYAGEYNAAYRMNAMSGKLVKVAGSPLRDGTFVTDVDQQPVLVYGQDVQGGLQVFHRPASSSQWKLLVQAAPNEPGFWPISSTGVKGEYFAFDNRGGPTRGVVVWSPEAQTEKVLFRHKDVDVSGYETDPTGRPWVFTYDDHFPDYFYPDPEHPLAQAHRWLRSQFKGHAVSIPSQTDDLSLAVAEVSSPVTPPIFLVVDVKNRKLLQHLPSRPDLSAGALAQVEPIEFTARDGMKIRGFLTVPAGSSGKRLPTIVVIHGGPHGVYDAWGFDYETQLFASRGYAILQVNYRGSAGRGAVFQGAGYGKWGREIQDDITDGVRWAIGDGVADPQRICAYGGSFGAYAALTGAFREPDLFKCVVGIAGVYDLSLMFQEGDIQTVQRGINYLKAAIGTDTEEQKRRSPVYNADKIRAAVMLLHGKIDERAPIEHAIRMRDALVKQGRPPVWITEWGEGHGFFDEGNRLSAYQQILTFFAKHLGTDAPAAAATSGP
jgi:dipeptidyl aminopeptidase/acylaminoacyl peptidase